MKTSFPIGRLLVCAFLLAIVLVVTLGAIGWATLPLDRTMLTLDGETVALSGLDGWRAVLVVAAIFLALLIAVIVAAAAIVVAVLAAAFAAALAVAVVLATLAITASPAILILWLLYVALRAGRAPKALTA